jgi:hypothetical protein
MDNGEFEAYTSDAVKELWEKIESFHRLHGLETRARRWDVDLHQVPATLRFFDKDDNVLLACDVIEFGTFSPPTQSWLWAFNNKSLPPEVREQALPIKQLQQISGRDYFAIESPIAADVDFAWQLAAISVKHLSALACYDANLNDGELYAYLAITGIRSGS